MTQISFDDDRSLTLRERFQRFDERHPEVFDGLADLCRRTMRKGLRRWSIDAAFHVLRWERRMAGLPDADESFKLNNDYTAFYARALMERCPDLDGIFETRKQVTA